MLESKTGVVLLLLRVYVNVLVYIAVQCNKLLCPTFAYVLLFAAYRIVCVSTCIYFKSILGLFFQLAEIFC